MDLFSNLSITNNAKIAFSIIVLFILLLGIPMVIKGKLKSVIVFFIFFNFCCFRGVIFFL
ncbi:hypothetical protein COO03_04645 [Bacillus sp. AFS098217]|nr:hypothetical protein COO03_04645 [Bacillus sp. AFS098217]